MFSAGTNLAQMHFEDQMDNSNFDLDQLAQIFSTGISKRGDYKI